MTDETPPMITITINEAEQWGEPCVIVNVLPDRPLPYVNPDLPSEDRTLTKDATRSEQVAFRIVRMLDAHEEWIEADFMLAVMQPISDPRTDR